VAGFGRPEINHPRFILKAAGDSVRANLEQLGDLTHREDSCSSIANCPVFSSRFEGYARILNDHS
jgi:hypothetical protein